MDYEKLSREELLKLLRELTLPAAGPDGQPPTERLLHELQVHQIELEMQNRELRDAQGALEESRNRYADLYDFAPVAYCTVDGQGLVEELNLTAATLIGRDRQHAIGRPLTSLVRFEDPRRFWQHLGTCTLSAEAVVNEFRLIIKDRIIDVEAISVPVLSLGGRPRTFRTAFMDISRRKRAEAEREAAYFSEQRLRNLLEALDRAHIEAAQALARPGRAGLREVMDVIVQHARRLTEADQATLALSQLTSHFGLTQATCGDQTVEGSAPDAYTLDVRLSYGERALATLTVKRAQAHGPFGSQASGALAMLAERLASSLEIARLRTLEARETLRLSLLEQVERALGRAQDVEATGRAVDGVARALVPGFADLCMVHLIRDGGPQLQRLVHADPVREQALVVQLRDEQQQQRVTSALSELAHAREPQLFHSVGQDAAEVDAPYADLMRTLQTAALIVAPLWARERLLGTICFGRAGLGEQYDLGVLGWAQELAGRCAAALDVTLLVQELREAVQWRENLMAMISHDLKNPLSVIALSAVSMTPEKPLVERRSSHRQVELIRRSADHMHHMINDLLSANLLKSGTLSVELRRESGYQLAEEACELAAPLLTARSLELERAFTADLPYVFADRDLIQRVFSNLLGNAAKFTPRGGRIRVSASYSDSRVIYCVSDSGPGIPEEQQAQLFDRYWKGRSGAAGLGLGLYIAKSIVEAHKGRIWLERGSGPGATFCFDLRRCEPAH
jgi:PAS domain S-box-containing protein